MGLRRRIGESFELAALPGTSEKDRKKALHFCVVGGGPTGVEFAGTLRDFVRGDLSRKYPELMADVQVIFCSICAGKQQTTRINRWGGALLFSACFA